MMKPHLASASKDCTPMRGVLTCLATRRSNLCQTAALRLEGAKDRMLDSKVAAAAEILGSARKPRADVFHQTIMRPERKMDEQTGRRFLQVTLMDRSPIS